MRRNKQRVKKLPQTRPGPVLPGGGGGVRGGGAATAKKRKKKISEEKFRMKRDELRLGPA